ncbi:MAG: hypothetical protein AAGA69_03950 [Pseudomonadota bacterium]
MMHRMTAAVAAIFVLIVSPAMAGDNFSSKDVENFIGVMKDLDGFEDRYPDLDTQMGIDMESPDALANIIDDNGNIAIFTNMMPKMPAGPARKEATAAIKKNGFSSVDKFAGKADSIMAAFMAIEMEGQDMSMVNSMDDAMLASMPPQVQQQFGTIKKMISAVGRVPASDVETLRPLLPQLKAAMDN